MDEMNEWVEVIRALLPQSFAVRIAWQSAGLIIASPGDERVAWVDRFELAKLTPSAAVELILDRLRRPERNLSARLSQAIAV
jgi:hypothetical protein